MPGFLSAKYPLLIPLLGLVSGLIIQKFGSLSLSPSILLGAIAITVLIMILFCRSFSGPQNARYFSAICFMAFLLLGVANYSFFIRSTELPGKGYQLLQITSKPLERDNSYAVKAEILDTTSLRSNGKLVLYFQKNPDAKNLEPGNLILLRLYSNDDRSFINPGEFDYQEYLQTQGIKGSYYANKEQWKLIDSSAKYSLVSKTSILKARLLESISAWSVSTETSALVNALVLGERKGLQTKLLDQYAGAGAMHVLALSGLHIGIFYFILNLLLRPVLKIRYGKLMVFSITLIILWGFALLTGLSSSVVRAVSMFSILALGNISQRRNNTYNSLITSAFALLLIWPGYIFQPGFQLSYAALLGIVSLFPLFRRLWDPKLKLFKSIRDILCVSLAAQIGTFPISIYYFHQFPLLFLLTNLVVIPLITLILYLSIVCIIISLSPMEFSLAFQILEFVCNVMSTSVGLIDSFGFTLDNISISAFTVILLFGFILSLYLYFLKRNFRRLQIAWVLAVALISQLISEESDRRKLEFTVYALKNSFAMGIYKDNEGFLITSEAASPSSKQLEYKIQGHQLQRGISKLHQLCTSDKLKADWLILQQGLLLTENEQIWFYQEQKAFPEFATIWIVPYDCAPPDRHTIPPEKIIISSLVSEHNSKLWCKWASLSFVWNIKDLGAYTSS